MGRYVEEMTDENKFDALVIRVVKSNSNYDEFEDTINQNNENEDKSYKISINSNHKKETQSYNQNNLNK